MRHESRHGKEIGPGGYPRKNKANTRKIDKKSIEAKALRRFHETSSPRKAKNKKKK